MSYPSLSSAPSGTVPMPDLTLTSGARSPSVASAASSASSHKAAARRRMWVMAALALCAALACLLYLFSNVNPKFFDYAMSLRIPRLAGIVTAAVAVAGASLVFQTVIRNHIVTPCLLGMNSLYVLIHTVVAFVFGATSAFAADPVAQFAADLVLMGLMGLLIYGVLFEKTGGNVLYILLIGTVLTTFFSSIQASLVRMMDPNEYDALLTSLTASFTNVSAPLIPPALAILAGLVVVLRRDLAVLNILALGRDAATSLGVDYERTTRRLLVGVALSIAVATALVGPISFLGLITANLSRRLFVTYRHGTLVAGSVLIGIVVLAGGQFAVEHLAAFSVPVSVFITITGGVYFLYLILRSKGL